MLLYKRSSSTTLLCSFNFASVIIMSAIYLTAAMPDSSMLHQFTSTCCATEPHTQSLACLRIASICHSVLSRACKQPYAHYSTLQAEADTVALYPLCRRLQAWKLVITCLMGL